jgi:methylthioribose-1-phosphate isomerase
MDTASTPSSRTDERETAGSTTDLTTGSGVDAATGQVSGAAAALPADAAVLPADAAVLPAHAAVLPADAAVLPAHAAAVAGETAADAAPVEAAAATGPQVPSHDAARRAFFRELGRSALTTVGQVAGLADVMGRGTTAAAAGLLGIDLREPTKSPARPLTPGTPRTTPRTTRATTDDQYRSPYRVTDDTLILLDQRALPGALEELTCRRGTDVAYYLRTGACRGGPLMAQVAAYGLALTARERRAQPAATRGQDLRRSRNALTSARPTSRALAWAVDRMAAVEEAAGEEPDGDALAAVLRGEADAIALRMQADLDAVADHLSALLADAHDRLTTEDVPTRPLQVLVHGDPGALWGGLVGPGVAALGRFIDSGRAVRVVLTEGRPFLEGARLAAWELRQARIPNQLIADAAVAWLFMRQPVDLVILAAEAVAANGDVAALIGARAIADLAAATRERDGSARPRVIALATGTTIAPAILDGSAFPDERRTAREFSSQVTSGPMPGTDTLNPVVDVIPYGRIDTLVTERGPIAPVTADAVLAAVPD